ncbi:24844_t:CDS:2 [Dentiscutata erythropus]|uniref:24844_t:CDS:1 n=1 Tax=Dentiscutata erythropus TaxID=1348616 RepID=A0A9N9JN35_9GLOM|nr:24844_t:CDS:2 [Dentiscutata erythropus]
MTPALGVENVCTAQLICTMILAVVIESPSSPMFIVVSEDITNEDELSSDKNLKL